MKCFNIYCDESCHLENSLEHIMVLGAIVCPEELRKEAFTRIKEIRKNHNAPRSEVKWTKVSKGKLPLYKDIIDYFFDRPELGFRAIFLNKKNLNHSLYKQTHDAFYYKTYFRLLERLIDSNAQYKIYLDMKDTQGASKVEHLRRVLCSAAYDTNNQIINKIQLVRSHEVALLQLVDIFIGAVQYANRFPDGGKSAAKNELIEYLKHKSNISLLRSTYLGESKFNLFHWEGKNDPA